MSRSRTPSNPRKIPVQARSRATVDAIIQAATYILMENGWDSFSTNAIAERAGVNIGSLYQFFPNKEAVLAEVQRRHALETRTALQSTLQGLSKQPSLREVLTLIIEKIIIEHRVAPLVHKAVTDELPRTLRWMPEEKKDLQRQVMETLKPHMCNVPDPDLAAFLMSVATEAIVHNVTTEHPELLNNPSLITELVAMFEGYLSREQSNH